MAESRVDPGRKYGTSVDKNNNTWKCNFCFKVTNGGVSRLTHHLIGGFRNAKDCKKCPEHVREELRNHMLKKAEDKAARMMPEIPVDVDEYDVEEEMEGGYTQKSQSKKRKQRGPLNRFITSTPLDILKGGKDMKSIFGVCDRELRDKACGGIARWMYDAGISFNAVTYDSFPEMCELIGQYGMRLKPPSMHELRVMLLKKEVNSTLTQLVVHKKEWATKGCSIISDGWRDKDIINFLVNSLKGSVFIKSKDVSEVVKDSTLLFQLLDDMVEEVGEANVVQVVTDNASNYVSAGKLLEAKRPNLYWTLCAAHCIDLMLEDIGRLTPVKNALKKCIFMNGYIYSRISLLNMMRRFTNQRNLHRPVVTRFATSFITMAQYHKEQKNLKKMVNSDEFNESKWPKEVGAKKVKQYIMQDSFWRNVTYALKLTGPLVKVLRLVDGGKNHLWDTSTQPWT